MFQEVWNTKGVEDMLHRATKTPHTATLHGFNLIYSSGEVVNLNAGASTQNNGSHPARTAHYLQVDSPSGTDVSGTLSEMQNQHKIVLYYLVNCPFSEQARDLLQVCNNRQDLVMVTLNDSTKEAMRLYLQRLGVQNPVTFPQIFWYGTLILGGFAGLKNHLKNLR